MLTSFGLAFSQKYDGFLLTMGRLGKPLTILPFISCPYLARGPLVPSLGLDLKAITSPYNFFLPLRSLTLTGLPTASSSFSLFQNMHGSFLNHLLDRPCLTQHF